jgi:hypothetical protein
VIANVLPSEKKMPGATSSMVSRRYKTWLVLSIIVLSVCFLGAITILIGRIPVRGHISFSQDQSDRFGQIMKENGIIFWTGIGGLEMMGVEFDNPFALATVDDIIIEDARRNSYQAIIRYECVIPYFNHTITAN